MSIFVDTVKATEFRDKLKENMEKVIEDEALQIIHKNGPVRVLITQEHYFSLIENRDRDQMQVSDKTVKSESADEIARRIQRTAEKYDIDNDL